MNRIKLKDGREYLYPSSWEEVEFQLWERFHHKLTNRPDSEDEISWDSMIELMCIVTGLERQVFLDEPIDFFNEVFESIRFMFDHGYLDSIQMKKTININGLNFWVDDNPDIPFGQWIDRDNILDNWKEEEKLAAMLAVMLIEEKNQKYTTDEFEKRLQLIKHSKIVDVYPLLAFFLGKRKALLTCLEVFSTGGKIFELEMEMMKKETELLSGRNGAGRTSFFNWRMATSLSAMQFLEREYSRFSHLLHGYQTRASLSEVNSATKF